ncbi:MAG: hypothetical protein JRH18_14285 [Deltaproteobacteria bacterium]|nr:hypothetical protein [Deltaproteobacteria bacterium]MBW1993097.1 hypothetical protein [Deltaproteobacteria bacterium]MBW2152824.1 hypothetical protein [Deltaproteobacteria bacterium]
MVVVSEERSEVSLARSGRLDRMNSPDELAHLVEEALKIPTPPSTGLLEKIRSLLITRWRLKLGTLGLVSALWLLFAGQQDFEVSLQVPLEVRNLPAQMEILQPLNPRIKITIRGLRKDASTVNPAEVSAYVDLSMAGLGRRIFRILPDQVSLPNEQVNVVRIEPSEIFFEFKEKDRDSAR